MSKKDYIKKLFKIIGVIIVGIYIGVFILGIVVSTYLEPFLGIINLIEKSSPYIIFILSIVCYVLFSKIKKIAKDLETYKGRISYLEHLVFRSFIKKKEVIACGIRDAIFVYKVVCKGCLKDDDEIAFVYTRDGRKNENIICYRCYKTC
jgi:hypothetical protein